MRNTETMMDAGSKLLSEVTVYDKYSNFLPKLNRKETWEEVVNRYIDGHMVRYTDKLANTMPDGKSLKTWLLRARRAILRREVLPSMRGLQFGGAAVRAHNARMFNCSYHAVDSWEVFHEFLYLLLCGSGVGYSVRRHHVNQLPAVKEFEDETVFRTPILDSIEGWAEAVRHMFRVALVTGGKMPVFDYRYIRPAGSIIKSTGARAPGPEPLRVALENALGILREARGRKLRPIEVHEIICFLSQCVRAGGVRRSSLICIFDRDDQELLYCKSGRGWPAHLTAANNSAAFPRKSMTREEFAEVWQAVATNGTGEPGYIWFDDDNIDGGMNPCAEAGLRSGTFCNLSTINAPAVRDYAHAKRLCELASFLGTLQAGYTAFNAQILRDHWRKNTEEDALIGVSWTGIVGSEVQGYSARRLRALAETVNATNAACAALIGVNTAARTTLIKPEGTTSCALGGINPGIHAGHGKYWIRRMIIPAGSPLHGYLERVAPGLVTHKLGDANAYLCVPVRLQHGDTTREEGARAFLDRVFKWSEHWVTPGHRRGIDRHNVSATCNVKPHEWAEVGELAWEKRDLYAGISFFPYSDAHYDNLPFEEIDEQEYRRMLALVPTEYDLSEIVEYEGKAPEAEAACAGGACLL